MNLTDSSAALNRRAFLKMAAAASGAALCSLEASSALAGEQRETGLVDVNINLGRWPLRRLPNDETGSLVVKLRSRGVTQAWASSFDGILHKDMDAVNARLVQKCQRYGRGRLLPFGAINPQLLNWERDLRTCAEGYHMHGIRLHPNYHGYRLQDPIFIRLLKLAAEYGLIVQLALVMEDERMMHPRFQVEPVDPTPLAEVIQQTPRLRLVLLNALRTLRGEPLRKLVSAGEVYVEISMLEGVGGVNHLLEQVPANRVLFGSHAPLFYFEAAELKLKESILTSDQDHALRYGNAQRLLG